MGVAAWDNCNCGWGLLLLQEHQLTQQTNQLLALKRENDGLNKRLKHMER